MSMGAAIELREDYDAVELRRLAGKAKDANQARRLLALAAVYDGQDRELAARVGGMDRQTLRDWVIRYNEQGLDGLVSRRGGGRRAALSQAQMAELLALVVTGPDPERDRVVRWRCVDLRDEVERRFEVRVHENTIGAWLRQMKLTRLQPRPFHPRKDPAAQEAFKKTSPI